MDPTVEAAGLNIVNELQVEGVGPENTKMLPNSTSNNSTLKPHNEMVQENYTILIQLSNFI
jgi:hypothetical protein